MCEIKIYKTSHTFLRRPVYNLGYKLSIETLKTKVLPPWTRRFYGLLLLKLLKPPRRITFVPIQ